MTEVDGLGLQWCWDEALSGVWGLRKRPDVALSGVWGVAMNLGDRMPRDLGVIEFHGTIDTYDGGSYA